MNIAAKKILIVSPVPCYPQHSGNATRIAKIIEQFKVWKIDFCFLHLPDSPFDPEPMRASLGNRYIYKAYEGRRRLLYRLRWRWLESIIRFRQFRAVKVDDFIDRGDITFFRNTLGAYKPDLVYVNYTYYSRLFDVTPSGTLKILDTHDSLHLRFINLYSGEKPMERFRISVKDEIKALNRADRVICIQDVERDFFRENGCLSDLFTVGHSVDIRFTTRRNKRKKLLYVASNYSANQNAISYFIRSVWNGLKLVVPEAELTIAGEISNWVKVQEDLMLEGIEPVGLVEEIFKLYENTDVAINPVSVGSGLKIKNIESLSFGKPVVTSSVGEEGLENFRDIGLLVASSPKEYCMLIEKLLIDQDFYDDQISQLHSKLSAYNSRNADELYEALLLHEKN